MSAPIPSVGDRVRFVSKHDGRQYEGRVTFVQPVSGRVEIKFRGPMVKSVRPENTRRATFAIRYPHELEVVS